MTRKCRCALLSLHDFKKTRIATRWQKLEKKLLPDVENAKCLRDLVWLRICTCDVGSNVVRVESAMKQEDLSLLFARPARKRNCVLSLYLNVDQSEPANLNRGFETRLKEMASALRKSQKHGVEREALASALHRVTDFVSVYRAAGCALAVFVDDSDGFFWHGELPFRVTNEIRWDREPLLQPLANALDELESYGVVLADRTKFRLFGVQLGQIEEILSKEISAKRVRHVKRTGSEHAESSSRMQRKADNQVRSNLREMVRQVDRVIQSNRIRRLVIAGTPETTAELRDLLPARVALNVIGETPLRMDASPEQILKVTRPISEAYERRTEVERINQVITAAQKKERAVLGLGHTLHALNSGRVWELIYSAGFVTPGFECLECFALFSTQTPVCAYCGSKVAPVHNVVERAVEHAIRKQAKVEVVKGEASASLDSAGGIGAFLKTRTKAALAG